MSGRGGARGGGRGRGRGAFANNLPAMGFTYQELSQLSREPSALYPPMDMPNMPSLTEAEARTVSHQIAIIERMKQSPYWIVEEEHAAKELTRYSDQFRQKTSPHPTLQQASLNQEFFPSSLWDGYFNPTKKPKAPEPKKPKRKRKVDIDALGGDEKDDAEGAEGEDGAQSEEGSEQPDYDVEDLEGDDYEANYFDNGEGDDDDDMGDGGGGGGGGGGDYD